MYIYTIFFFNPFLCQQRFGLLPCLGYWNTGVHVSFQIIVFSRYEPRIGNAGSYGSSIAVSGCFFLRNLHSILHSGCVNLHSINNVETLLFSIPSPEFLAYTLFLFLSQYDWKGNEDFCSFLLMCLYIQKGM